MSVLRISYSFMSIQIVFVGKSTYQTSQKDVRVIVSALRLVFFERTFSQKRIVVTER